MLSPQMLQWVSEECQPAIGRVFSCPILFFGIVKHLHKVTQSKANCISVVMKSYILPQWREREKKKHRRRGPFYFTNNKKLTFSVSFSLGTCWESGSVMNYISVLIVGFCIFHFWKLSMFCFFLFFFNICKVIPWNDFLKIFPEFSAKDLWVTFPTLCYYRSFFRTDELLICPRAGLYGQIRIAWLLRCIHSYYFVIHIKWIHCTPYSFYVVIV